MKQQHENITRMSGQIQSKQKVVRAFTKNKKEEKTAVTLYRFDAIEAIHRKV